MPVSGETILVKREVEEGGNTQAAMVLNAGVCCIERSRT